MIHILGKLYLFSILFLLFFSQCNANQDSRIEISGQAEGTYYSIIYYDELKRNFRSDIELFFKKFDEAVSLWEPNSTICKVNRNEKVVLDSVFVDIFQKSKAISKSTNGSFDFTIGPLTAAWGFGFSEKEKLSQKKIDSLLQIVGYKRIRLKNGTIVKENPNIKLDFNAIAKGYSVDLLGKFLESKGIKNFLVNVGGEIIAKGTKPQNMPWVVGIEKPTADKNDQQQVQAKIELYNMALATSGNYRNYYEENGVRYPHTIDPKTGFPVKHSLLSVSVLSRNCWEADAYATAFMVMGMEKALTLLKGQPQLEAYFIYFQDGMIKTFATEGFKKLVFE